jgi:hypothetical protein
VAEEQRLGRSLLGWGGTRLREPATTETRHLFELLDSVFPGFFGPTR